MARFEPRYVEVMVTLTVKFEFGTLEVTVPKNGKMDPTTLISRKI